MKNRIITSGESRSRSGPAAFFLSLLITGMGQVYNGNLSRGLAFFALRFLSLLIVPLYASTKFRDSYLFLFAGLVLFQIAVVLASPVEALQAAGKPEGPRKNYQSPLWYAVFGMFNFFLTLSAGAAVFLMFGASTVPSDRMDPTLREGEWVLVSRFGADRCVRGDVVEYSLKGKRYLARILAKEGEKAGYSGAGFSVDGADLPLGVSEEEKGALESPEDLFFETSENRRYMVRCLPPVSPGSPKKASTVTVGKNSLLVAFDNRKAETVYEIIDVSAVRGRVEGVIWSGRVKRLFSRTFQNI